MTLITRSEWGARAPRRTVSGLLSSESTCHWNGPTVLVNGQTTWDHSKCASLVRGIQNFHMDGRGWSDIAYNFIVCPHGHFFEGRGTNVVNAANGTNLGNKTSHTIMCLGGEGNPFSEEEKAGFRECVSYISDSTSAPDSCKGHRDWHSTACPGDERYNWVHRGMPVSGLIPQPPPANSTTPPSSPPPTPPAFGDWPHIRKPLIQEGSNGEVVAYLQRVISAKAGGNIGIDGRFGPQTNRRVRDVQRFFGLSSDGKVGPKTWGVIDFLAVH